MERAAAVAFSACTGKMYRAQGAFDELRKFVLGPSERDPHRPFYPIFKALNCYEK
jgi:hypothetical protein